MARIIIVEDEAIIADEIQMMLELMGHEVVANIQNGDRALDAFALKKAELALLDITIKGSLNGIDLARIIREKYNFPFVFLTSHSDMGTLSEVKTTYPYGYIVKPFTQQNLLTAIELALHQHAAEQRDPFPTLSAFSEQLGVQFTTREHELLQSLCEGLTYKEIAAKHFLSVNTIKSHLKQVFQKMRVSSRHEAVTQVHKLR
ncbi:MAG: response regulator transcription factor [Bacteroidota bacterium]